jgi:hypothetical protein
VVAVVGQTIKEQVVIVQLWFQVQLVAVAVVWAKQLTVSQSIQLRRQLR